MLAQQPKQQRCIRKSSQKRRIKSLKIQKIQKIATKQQSGNASDKNKASVENTASSIVFLNQPEPAIFYSANTTNWEEKQMLSSALAQLATPKRKP